jgi:cytoskeletal protein CcmA (bactofilin family)
MLFSGRQKHTRNQASSSGISTRAPIEIETVIGPNTSVQGDIRSSGGVRVDGDFGGSIDIAGNLVIGENSQVVADITAHNVQVQGTLQGNVTAHRLEILDTGKVWGDIAVDSFVLDDGGFYRGQSRMQGENDPPLLEASHESEPEIVDVEPSEEPDSETEDAEPATQEPD